MKLSSQQNAMSCHANLVNTSVIIVVAVVIVVCGSSIGGWGKGERVGGGGCVIIPLVMISLSLADVVHQVCRQIRYLGI